MRENYDIYIRKLRFANSVNLRRYLQDKHPDVIKRNNGEYVHSAHDSLKICEQFWHRKSTNHGGDVVSFLEKWLDYKHLDAINELCEYGGDHTERLSSSKIKEPKTMREIPEPCQEKIQDVIHYLTKLRHLDKDIVEKLIKQGDLFADKKGNAVFVNVEETFAVIRGTYGGLSNKFKSSVVNDYCPYITFMPSTPVETVYVTESPIDSISLYMLLSPEKKKGAAFCAMGGLIPETIKRIQWEFYGADICIAVDCDDAGNKFFKNLPYIGRRMVIPEQYRDTCKDWNALLCERIKRNEM